MTVSRAARNRAWKEMVTVGTIAVHEFITLDGVIEAPSWSFDYPYDPAMDEAIGQIMGSCKAILLGRRTYQEFAPAWSGRTAEEDPGAPFMNESPKYAVSASLQTGRRCWIRHRGRSSRWLWRSHLAPGHAEMDPLGLRLG